MEMLTAVYFSFYQTLNVSRTMSYEITPLRLSVPLSAPLSVCPSARPSLSFLKIGLILFSDVVHDES